MTETSNFEWSDKLLKLDIDILMKVSQEQLLSVYDKIFDKKIEVSVVQIHPWKNLVKKI